MRPRGELHTIFKTILGTDRAYFQPPPSIRMIYPCIVYRLSDVQTKFADNRPYNHTRGYEVIVIDKSPDSNIPAQIADLPMTSFDRTYVADHLYPTVYTLFF